jgi:hypothetical protein
VCRTDAVEDLHGDLKGSASTDGEWSVFRLEHVRHAILAQPLASDRVAVLRLVNGLVDDIEPVLLTAPGPQDPLEASAGVLVDGLGDTGVFYSKLVSGKELSVRASFSLRSPVRLVVVVDHMRLVMRLIPRLLLASIHPIGGQVKADCRTNVADPLKVLQFPLWELQDLWRQTHPS